MRHGIRSALHGHFGKDLVGAGPVLDDVVTESRVERRHAPLDDRVQPDSRYPCVYRGLLHLTHEALADAVPLT